MLRLEKRAPATPKPTPSPIVHSRTIATNSGAAAPIEPIHHAGATRPRIARIHTRPTAMPLQPRGAAGAGVGRHADAGSTGAGGAGSGAGASGGGAGAGVEPCGEVDFAAAPADIVHASDGSTSIVVKMTVHFGDGHAETLTLDYPWHYPDERSNPFAPQYLDKPDAEVPPARFQAPPPAQATGEPPLVQYVVHHSTPDGRTLLRDCPPATSPTP